jgi:hypothetical protein
MMDIDDRALAPILTVLRQEEGPSIVLRNPTSGDICPPPTMDDCGHSYANRCASLAVPYGLYAKCALKYNLVVLDLAAYVDAHVHWRAVKLVCEWLDNIFFIPTDSAAMREVHSAVQHVVRTLLSNGGFTESEFATL